ncbi:hypothetical protein [Streptomyces roseicoloratus]|uniref:Secreted protein n=1 Tax=Streptomyces roseicoloratus TaxID=2508722 RepID=A0ABY9RTN1_9ACTN|nr:hypothetical protein [Streptomyces roseicoloratus]WMX45320.1 hypothetical protein RGF97_11295 [Streptomyces roseicoloratus]
MNLRSHAGLGLLAAAIASAALASPAAADAPVVVPLQGLDPVLPMDAPTVASGVPTPIPGAPTGFHEGVGALPDLTLPRIPLESTLSETDIAAPLPEVLRGSEPGTAEVTSPRSDMKAVTPGATVGTLLHAPNGNGLGLPGVGVPEVGVLTPALNGALDPQLGLAP